MAIITNDRLRMLMQIHQNTHALVTDGLPVKGIDLDPSSNDVDDYDLDISAASAQVDDLLWEVFCPFLLGIPPLYYTVPDDYWPKRMADIGMVDGDPLSRFLTFCGEEWAWVD